jgi:hypothetical protein
MIVGVEWTGVQKEAQRNVGALAGYVVRVRQRVEVEPQVVVVRAIGYG